MVAWDIRVFGYSNTWPQETDLATRSKNEDAKAQFDKLQRVEDGKKAMADYEAEAIAVRAKTARLRALRLARDAAEQSAAAAAPAPAKKKAVKTTKTTKAKSAKLAEWLDDQKEGGHKS
jgi:hypothetical protein